MSLRYFEAEQHVSTYDKFRPRPPESLIASLMRYAREELREPLELAVDVGCGSGQSTEILAPYFKRIVGLDSSDEIIVEARKKCRQPNTFYRTGEGEKMDIDSNSVDVLTVCQAVHWFNLLKFYPEVQRVLKSKGVFAVYGYNLPQLICEGHSECEYLVEKYYKDVLADYTFPQSRKVYIDKYAAKEFNEIDFIEGGKMLRMENFVQESEGTLNDIAGYMASWSAFQNYTKQMGEDKGKKLLQTFKNEFKFYTRANAIHIFKIRFNYFLLMGRKQ